MGEVLKRGPRSSCRLYAINVLASLFYFIYFGENDQKRTLTFRVSPRMLQGPMDRGTNLKQERSATPARGFVRKIIPWLSISLFFFNLIRPTPTQTDMGFVRFRRLVRRSVRPTDHRISNICPHYELNF